MWHAPGLAGVAAVEAAGKAPAITASARAIAAIGFLMSKHLVLVRSIYLQVSSQGFAVTACRRNTTFVVWSGDGGSPCFRLPQGIQRSLGGRRSREWARLPGAGPAGPSR